MGWRTLCRNVLCGSGEIQAIYWCGVGSCSTSRRSCLGSKKKRFLNSVTVVRQVFLSKRKLLHAFADTSVGSRCSEDGYSPESWPETFRFRFASCIPGPMKFGSALCWMSDISTSEAGTRVQDACSRAEEASGCVLENALNSPYRQYCTLSPIQGHRFFAITWIDSLLLSFFLRFTQVEMLPVQVWSSKVNLSCDVCMFFSKYFCPLYSKSSFVVLGFCRWPYQCGTSRYLWQTIELLHGDKEMWIWKFERVFVAFEHGVEVREEAVDTDKRLSSKFSSTCQ